MKRKLLSEVQTQLKELPVYLANLITELLYGEDFAIKHNARISLVKMGKRIIPSIHKLLSSKNTTIRMEAAKVVELVATPRSIPFLITLMDDPVFDIRWIAAEGLVRIGRKSIKPILISVCGNKSTLFFDESAHHVLGSLLYDNEKLSLSSLMLSLDNHHETGETTPVEAAKALKMFRFNN
jgi:HEAT repeat protein